MATQEEFINAYKKVANIIANNIFTIFDGPVATGVSGAAVGGGLTDMETCEYSIRQDAAGSILAIQDAMRDYQINTGKAFPHEVTFLATDFDIEFGFKSEKETGGEAEPVFEGNDGLAQGNDFSTQIITINEGTVFIAEDFVCFPDYDQHEQAPCASCTLSREYLELIANGPEEGNRPTL